MESVASSRSPFCQATKPPYMLLDALPEPWRAIAVNCPGYSSLALYSLARVATKQARPAAEEARPAPVGNVFIEEMRTWNLAQSSFFTITSPVLGSTLS
jgi:hypothetical protein